MVKFADTAAITVCCGWTSYSTAGDRRRTDRHSSSRAYRLERGGGIKDQKKEVCNYGGTPVAGYNTQFLVL